MLKRGLIILAMSGGLFMPGAAFAAATAFTTTDLNIRTGPGAEFQRFDTIPQGQPVTVHGCLAGYNWCDISWGIERGWVSGDYLAYAAQGYARRPVTVIGPTIGLPVIRFDPYAYHRSYYANRPWYRDRYLQHRALEERREWRQIHREVREERQELRDLRRKVQEERRDLQKLREAQKAKELREQMERQQRLQKAQAQREMEKARAQRERLEKARAERRAERNPRRERN